MKINPSKINENLLVLMAIEILTFPLSINIDSVFPFLVWLLIVFILNNIAVYLLIKYKPKYYKASLSILLLLFYYLFYF